MTQYFYDLEFLEDGRTIDLISIGIVTPEGREYYAVNMDAEWERISQHDWLVANVLPSLPVRRHASGPRTVWLPDTTDPAVKTRATIAREVEAFIRAGGDDRADHELWADYGAYDHVGLCQLWGRMIDLPSCVPMFTCDLQQALSGTMCRRPACNCRESLPVQTSGLHNALEDARHNLAVARAIGVAPLLPPPTE